MTSRSSQHQLIPKKHWTSLNYRRPSNFCHFFVGEGVPLCTIHAVTTLCTASRWLCRWISRRIMRQVSWPCEDEIFRLLPHDNAVTPPWIQPECIEDNPKDIVIFKNQWRSVVIYIIMNILQKQAKEGKNMWLAICHSSKFWNTLKYCKFRRVHHSNFGTFPSHKKCHAQPSNIYNNQNTFKYKKISHLTTKNTPKNLEAKQSKALKHLPKNLSTKSRVTYLPSWTNF